MHGASGDYALPPQIRKPLLRETIDGQCHQVVRHSPPLHQRPHQSISTTQLCDDTTRSESTSTWKAQPGHQWQHGHGPSGQGQQTCSLRLPASSSSGHTTPTWQPWNDDTQSRTHDRIFTRNRVHREWEGVLLLHQSGSTTTRTSRRSAAARRDELCDTAEAIHVSTMATPRPRSRSQGHSEFIRIIAEINGGTPIGQDNEEQEGTPDMNYVRQPRMLRYATTDVFKMRHNSRAL